MKSLSPEMHQRKIVRVLGLAQVLNGIGVAGTQELNLMAYLV
jgi:hypothetical protein